MGKPTFVLFTGFSIIALIAVGCGDQGGNSNRRGRIHLGRTGAQGVGTNNVSDKVFQGADAQALQTSTLQQRSVDDVDQHLKQLLVGNVVSLDDVPQGTYQLQEILTVARVNKMQAPTKANANASNKPQAQIAGHNFKVIINDKDEVSFSPVQNFVSKTKAQNGPRIDAQVALTFQVLKGELNATRAIRYESIMEKGKPKMTVIIGDTNRTMVAELAANKDKKNASGVYVVAKSDNRNQYITLRGSGDTLILSKDSEEISPKGQNASRVTSTVLIYKKIAGAPTAAPTAGQATAPATPIIAAPAEVAPEAAPEATTDAPTVNELKH
ncbi:MAG: hypothetical protein AB7N80_00225 [Bdellovibrionales bacterium]